MPPKTPTPEFTPTAPEERLPTPLNPEAPSVAVPEQAPAKFESDPLPAPNSTNQNAGMPQVVPLPQPTAVPLEPTTTTVQDDDLPESAGDVDLIEKAWVNKAKAVVAETKDDPHTQNKELAIVKVGYLKKRYNRVVGQSET